MLQEYNFQSSRDSAARVRLKHTESSYSLGPKSHRRGSASLKETDEDKALTGMAGVSAGSRQQMDK